MNQDTWLDVSLFIGETVGTYFLSRFLFGLDVVTSINLAVALGLIVLARSASEQLFKNSQTASIVRIAILMLAGILFYYFALEKLDFWTGTLLILGGFLSAAIIGGTLFMAGVIIRLLISTITGKRNKKEEPPCPS